MNMYSKQTILNFLEANADFIAHDMLTDNYKQKLFNDKELYDLFAYLFTYPEKKLALFKPWVEWYQARWHVQ